VHQGLTKLAGELTENSFMDVPTYRAIYALAVSARLPGVVLGANGRWVYDAAQLPIIAASLGLTRASACAAG
jgi:hypothetical protein